MSLFMKAIILAAGYATRLYPLTEKTAKPLLLVKGQPIIDYTLEKLENCVQISEVFVVTNDKFFNDFVLWQQSKKSKKKITVINDKTKENGTRLGAIGDIDHVIQTQHAYDDLLVIAGDNLFSFEIEEFLKYYDQKQTTLVALFDTKDKKTIAARLGCVEIDKFQRVVAFEEKPEKPKTTLAATACYIFPHEDLHFIREAISQRHFDRPGDLIKFISAQKPVYGYLFSGYWYDVGTPEEYALVNKKSTKI